MSIETTHVQLSIEEIKFALENDNEFFIQFFLGSELSCKVPEFHIETFGLMTDLSVDKFACALPRDHAKTTLAKLACVKFFLFSHYRFILYLSNTISIAIPSVNDIINFLTSSNCEAVFGKVIFETTQEGKGVYKFWIGEKLCFLRAFGVGQQVRGINIDNQRPQIGVLDDVDAVQHEATEQAFRVTKRWFWGPFRKAMDKFDHKLVQIGNLTETQSLIAENCASEAWHSRVYGCLLSDGSPLWEEAWPVEKLKKEYQEYLEAGMADVWFAEMMNMPTAGGKGIILPEEIHYAPMRQEDDIKYGFITIDLAISDKTWAHKTVVGVTGWVEEGGDNGQWQAIDYSSHVGIDPISLFDEVMRLVLKWKVNVIGIESVAYQASLKYVFQHECLMNGIDFNEECIPGNSGISFVQMPAVGSKTQRIITWASMVKRGEYALNQGDFILTQELLTYRPDKKYNVDDHADCFAYTVYMLKVYMDLIMQEYTDIGGTTIEGSVEFC